MNAGLSDEILFVNRNAVDAAKALRPLALTNAWNRRYIGVSDGGSGKELARVVFVRPGQDNTEGARLARMKEFLAL